ncbi:hypothetical protein D3C75_996460 [compost metagenome]
MQLFTSALRLPARHIPADSPLCTFTVTRNQHSPMLSPVGRLIALQHIGSPWNAKKHSADELQGSAFTGLIAAIEQAYTTIQLQLTVMQAAITANLQLLYFHPAFPRSSRPDLSASACAVCSIFDMSSAIRS